MMPVSSDSDANPVIISTEADDRPPVPWARRRRSRPSSRSDRPPEGEAERREVVGVDDPHDDAGRQAMPVMISDRKRRMRPVSNACWSRRVDEAHQVRARTVTELSSGAGRW